MVLTTLREKNLIEATIEYSIPSQKNITSKSRSQKKSFRYSFLAKINKKSSRDDIDHLDEKIQSKKQNFRKKSSNDDTKVYLPVLDVLDNNKMEITLKKPVTSTESFSTPGQETNPVNKLKTLHNKLTEKMDSVREKNQLIEKVVVELAEKAQDLPGGDDAINSLEIDLSELQIEKPSEQLEEMQEILSEVKDLYENISLTLKSDGSETFSEVISQYEIDGQFLIAHFIISFVYDLFKFLPATCRLQKINLMIFPLNDSEITESKSCVFVKSLPHGTNISQLINNTVTTSTEQYFAKNANLVVKISTLKNGYEPITKNISIPEVIVPTLNDKEETVNTSVLDVCPFSNEKHLDDFSFLSSSFFAFNKKDNFCIEFVPVIKQKNLYFPVRSHVIDKMSIIKKTEKVSIEKIDAYTRQKQDVEVLTKESPFSVDSLLTDETKKEL